MRISEVCTGRLAIPHLTMGGEQAETQGRSLTPQLSFTPLLQRWDAFCGAFCMGPAVAPNVSTPSLPLSWTPGGAGVSPPRPIHVGESTQLEFAGRGPSTAYETAGAAYPGHSFGPSRPTPESPCIPGQALPVGSTYRLVPLS